MAGRGDASMSASVSAAFMGCRQVHGRVRKHRSRAHRPARLDREFDRSTIEVATTRDSSSEASRC